MFNDIFATKMEAAGLDKASASQTAQTTVSEAVKTAVTNTGNGNQTGVGIGPGGIKFDEKLVEIGKDCVMQSAREGATLTNKMFNLIRECKSYDIAKGTLMTAETRAIAAADERSQKEGGPRIRNLSQMADANGMDKLSYVQIKSNLFSAYDKRDNHKETVQELYNLKEKIEKAPHVVVQPGWLDIWNDRYADRKDGSRMFMKDLRFSTTAKGEVDKLRKQLQREAQVRNEATRQANEKAGAADTATNGPNAGIRSGGGHTGAPEIPEDVQPLMASFQRRVQDACKVLDHSVVNGFLTTATSNLNKMILEKLDSEKAQKAIKDGSAPPEITEAALADFERREAETATLKDKPEWYSKEEWLGFTDEERGDILADPEADKDSPQYIAWEASQPLSESEEKAIVEQGAELRDAAGG